MTPTWQSMETAPKSTVDEHGRVVGVYLLGYVPEPEEPDADPASLIRVIWWEPLTDGGVWFGDGAYPVKPTRWMPLPPPPAKDDAA